MKLNQTISQRLVELMKKHEKSQYKLIKESGLMKSTIISIIKQKNNDIKLSTIISLCQSLGITVYDFFDDEKFKDLNLE